MTLYANFHANVSHNLALAESLMQRAVALVPRNPQAWENLITMQTHLGQLERARTGIQRLRELNRFGRLDDVIRQLESQLARKASGRLPLARAGRATG